MRVVRVLLNLKFGIAMGVLDVPPPRPINFDRSIVFIDGTNTFESLKDNSLKVRSFYELASIICTPRRVHRVYLYTTQEKLDQAIKVHGTEAFSKCRIVFGDFIASNKKEREKGVDAQLVADVVYHAAVKNCEFIAIVSTDTDFRFALSRVEDFGVQTGLIAVAKPAAERLKKSCDDYLELLPEELISQGLAERVIDPP